MSAGDAEYAAWRAQQDVADDRDLDARAAFHAGFAWGRTEKRRPWHESLASIIIAVAILAAICYVLAGTPH